ncbi:DNA alkylation repair protein [Arthrobacter crystallopoietes]|uniref:3-methyladenine DNA glycosylase AlkC n=1 Tax=Crystallibacter crystallopoietes TaxID=37928 RepID=A0A1H1E100_9MICC|nr:DNA alkylation repair protein [Arthrobacter crystallopoietes]AUI50093.1 DNA alkylation repair protein [Arthrobacter crystallopoietes]SDQ82178.1 3-methyladenine DNA glycosylase AlkC [Arthrobacter crystallopoietes]
MGAMNDLLGPEAVEGLRVALGQGSLRSGWSALGAAEAKLEPLSLRARCDLLAAALLSDLDVGYGQAADVIRTALNDESFTGWMIWPVSEAAVTLALQDGTTRAFDDALTLLFELTPRLTGEFAIRRLLLQDLDRALAQMQDWTRHPDEQVRRLASEGPRPYLPWAVRVPDIIARPEATLPLLDALHTDSSQLVRRSVANHLNDIARHDPETVVALAGKWLGEPGDGTPWVVRHGLRTLVKKAHPGALALLGFTPNAVSVSVPELDQAQVQLPGEIAFTVAVRNDSLHPARLAVDYMVHYVKANGTLAPKVFKLAVAELEPGETRRFGKAHALRPMTTRVHYAGRHLLQVQVNGQLSAAAEFDVVI